MVHCTVPGQHLPPKEDKEDALEAMQFTHAQVVHTFHQRNGSNSHLAYTCAISVKSLV